MDKKHDMSRRGPNVARNTRGPVSSAKPLVSGDNTESSHSSQSAEPTEALSTANPENLELVDVTALEKEYGGLKFLALAQLYARTEDLVRKQHIRSYLNHKATELWKRCVFQNFATPHILYAEVVPMATAAVGATWGARLANAAAGLLDAQVEVLNNLQAKREEVASEAAASCHYAGSRAAAELLELVRKIPGRKIVTVMATGGTPSAFEVESSGTVVVSGQQSEISMLKLLDACLASSGSVIIRQFIPGASLTRHIHGKAVTVSWKAYFGFLIRDGRPVLLSAEAVEHCFSRNQDGTPRQEKMAIFRDISEFADKDSARAAR